MRHRPAIAAALACAATLAIATEDPFGFMPDGGRGLFVRIFPDAAAQREALGSERSRDDWRAALDTAAPGLATAERATLAAYLAAVTPREALDGDPAAALPQDGRDLALAQCQSCHSLFSGYLMQRRDGAGWLAIFKSPFHAKIPMSPAEQAIFADYSATNMPMRFEDVPPDLRF